jgi:serine/threonine protein kinase
MSLRRFPWKAPRMSDNSFKLFCTDPDPDYDPNAENQVGSQIKGPWRLLRLLPGGSRYIISRLLEVEPAKRADFDEVWKDDWINSLSFCTLDAEKCLIKGQDHEHTTVDGDAAHLDAYKKESVAYKK